MLCHPLDPSCQAVSRAASGVTDWVEQGLYVDNVVVDFGSSTGFEATEGWSVAPTAAPYHGAATMRREYAMRRILHRHDQPIDRALLERGERSRKRCLTDVVTAGEELGSNPVAVRVGLALVSDAHKRDARRSEAPR